MKRMYQLLVGLLLSVFFVGCFASNADIRPQDVYIREFKGLELGVARSDLSGVFLDVRSRVEKPVSIIWEKSRLGGSEIVRHDGIMNDKINHEVTTFQKLERKTFVLHRRDDFYYIDPVLYAKGGMRIKPLKYPVELKLVVKFLGKEETVSIFIDNNYTSTEDANSKKYSEDAYSKEAKANKKIRDKDYTERYLDGRTKAHTLPQLEAPFKDNPPIKDTLIIEHRKK